ncbi:wall-associated receptor kinase 2-like [Hibiscus syriacus]|uniref:Wall-associated receptor kinase 2-like n=1 Tax=Hibiscus syriacus TaxID=106335 RepID=A0A6A2YT34_HIBSY|nr:beta-glucosidase BoGH3B-like [Hibiscus syriacus]KAE8682470.1 wall-associated receptor kinase 2-like [Hibiscus syriacus]
MAKISAPLVGFLLFSLLVATAHAGVEYMKYKDPRQPISKRIRDLMKRMTLDEKIGQMVQIDRQAATAAVMRDYKIGSILSGGGSIPRLQASPQEWINMVNGFQNGSLSTRLGIPMIYGIDAVHGHNNVYNATVFPHNVGLGATRDPDLVKRIGSATALEVRATGISYVFAPCIAVCRDPRWGRCYESYSEDPNVVREMTDIINGLQGEIPKGSPKGAPYVGGKDKVVACAKHFVGDGGTTKGINENNTVIDRHGLLSIHMPGYNAAVYKGVGTVMASYSSWNGLKMHANRELVTDFLKGALRFRGFVISDWQALDRMTYPVHANYTYSVLTGIQAGLDMIMVPYNYTEFIDTLTGLVSNNFIPMSRIDDAVKRILRVKFTLGLFENPMADESFVDQLGHQAHRDLAREAVRKSLVLLKNGKNADEPMLPLPKNSSKILVAGSHADNLGNQCGGWTINWQGGDGNNLTAGTTILKGISEAVDPSTEIVYQENPDFNFVKTNNFSYGIIVVGEPPYAETAGDNLNLTIPLQGQYAIQNVCANIKCVVVLISGRPLVMMPHLEQVDSLIAAWLPGSEGQGVADVLFGDYGFSGKLPRTWFKTVEQLPMNVGDPNYDPLYPFGYGLTTHPVSHTS